MTVTIDISQEAANVLRSAFGEDLSRAALEAIAVEGYRSGRLSRFEIQTLLKFDSRWDTEEWLACHGVNSNYSVADLEADRRTLDELLGPAQK